MPSEGTSLMIQKVKPSYENNDVFAFSFGRSNIYSVVFFGRKDPSAKSKLRFEIAEERNYTYKEKTLFLKMLNFRSNKNQITRIFSHLCDVMIVITTEQ